MGGVGLEGKQGSEGERWAGERRFPVGKTGGGQRWVEEGQGGEGERKAAGGGLYIRRAGWAGYLGRGEGRRQEGMLVMRGEWVGGRGSVSGSHFSKSHTKRKKIMLQTETGLDNKKLSMKKIFEYRTTGTLFGGVQSIFFSKDSLLIGQVRFLVRLSEFAEMSDFVPSPVWGPSRQQLHAFHLSSHERKKPLT